MLDPTAVTDVVDRLRTRYGSPRLGNHDDPVDELVFIILSQMTTEPSYTRVFDRLRRMAPSWEVIAETDEETLAHVIADAGLARLKAPRILAILRRLAQDFGNVSLDALREMDDAQVEGYLVTLPGVGRKTAKCVMMYSLGRRVLPIDTHVRRVAVRLGFLDPSSTAKDEHLALEAVVAPEHRYDFHVNAIPHGRVVCRPHLPRCGECVLVGICAEAEDLWESSRRAM